MWGGSEACLNVRFNCLRLIMKKVTTKKSIVFKKLFCYIDVRCYAQYIDADCDRVLYIIRYKYLGDTYSIWKYMKNINYMVLFS